MSCQVTANFLREPQIYSARFMNEEGLLHLNTYKHYYVGIKYLLGS